MDRFIKELMVGDIHLRDRWQIELKSEFVPNPRIRHNTFTQEFFFFIPNSLQINEETYPNSEFYQDRTNLLRYKTPEFSLKQLYNPNNQRSPLTRLSNYDWEKNPQEAIVELKLLGNIVRSAIRERVKFLVLQVHSNLPLNDEINDLYTEMTTLRQLFWDLQNKAQSTCDQKDLHCCFRYVDEFLSTTINYYLTGLLSEIKDRLPGISNEITDPLYLLLKREKAYRSSVLNVQPITDEDNLNNEQILYRNSLLNKYILDALLLETSSHTVTKQYSHLIGSISAAIAMLFFFVLFVYQGRIFISNSLPFILLTVFLYVLKDRIKESIRTSSFKYLGRWFYDYRTEIFSPDSLDNLGKLSESATYVDENRLPENIIDVRNREFHNVLESIKRPEKIIYYKKVITLYNHNSKKDLRRHALNLIFRYNIQHFLKKADNPSHDYLKVDSDSFKFRRAVLPKIYHINIIMKNTYLNAKGNQTVELKKFRLIIDKNGIKRIEYPRPKES